MGAASHGPSFKSHGRRNDAQVTQAIPEPLRQGIDSYTPKSFFRTPHIPHHLEKPPFPPNRVTVDPFPVSSQYDDPIEAASADAPPNASRPLMMGYYPDWVGSSCPPSKIDFKLFDWVDFAFAIPKADFTLAWDDDNAPQLLKQLIYYAHDQGTKIKLSVGGWTGSKYFSTAVASEENRATFVRNIADLYNTLGLDGIDIDWEYPGREGASGNQFHSADSDNFLLFLKLLRFTLPPLARITAAVETTTFAGATGDSMLDLSEFSKWLDWVTIMNYDVWGSSSNPGPNAPLHDACDNSTQPEANAVAAFKAWTAAKFPADKLILGLPSYGYTSPSTAEHLRVRSRSRKHQQSLQNTGLTVVSEDGGDDSQVQFRELVGQGALVPVMSATDNNGAATRTYVGNEGFERRWDGCSSTPFLRSASAGQIITYDDTESLAMKATFAKDSGMLGVNLFDIHGDTDDWALVYAIRKSMGLV